MNIFEFLNEMKEKTTKGLLEVSEGGKSVHKTHTFQIGQAETIIIRGGAIEKAGITHLTLRGIKVPGTDEEADVNVYHMKVFPENPSCPMGHLNIEWKTRGAAGYNITLDLFPALKIQEDLDAVRNAIDAVADQFGRDKSRIREILAVQYNMDHWSSPLSAKVGCQLKELKESDLNILMTAYRTFFDAYLYILSKRKDTQFGEEERRLNLERNSKWLQYFTLKDTAFRMALATNVPPEVLISLGYPPSAVF